MLLLHDLRHTRANMALARGVHLKIMQERLRHSRISVTDSYLTPGLQRDAANRIAQQALGSWRPAITVSVFAALIAHNSL